MNIGIIGLGGISQAHRAGYKHQGLPVVAGFDPSQAARDRFASAEPGARVYSRLEDLLNDPEVQVLDLATPHHRDARVPVVKQIARVGKPVLIQKPMAMAYEDALEITESLEASGVAGMVNQNMCFTAIGRQLPPVLIEQNRIGKPLFAHIELRAWFDCDPAGWFGKDLRWQTAGHTVHHLSLLHLLFGPPSTAYAVTGADPSMKGVPHEGFGHMILTYPSGMKAVVLSTSTYYGDTPQGYGAESIWIQGDRGIIDFHPEHLRVSLAADRDRPEAADRSSLIPLQGAWFPDAFGLVMKHFQDALAAGKAPLCSVQDNLYVMAAVEAVYQSASANRVVHLKDVMKTRYQSDYGPGYLHGHR